MDELISTVAPAVHPHLVQTACAILASFVLCSAIATVYRWTYQGFSYSRSFVHTLILGGIVTTVLIMAIGDNLARGLGILGTLAIIRFRTQIRDPRDIIFIFGSLATGIACGARVYDTAICGSLAFCLVALYLHWSPFASRREYEGLLRFFVPAGQDIARTIPDLLRDFCTSVQLIAIRDSGQGEVQEHSYQVQLRDPSYQPDLVEALRGVEGLTEPSLLMQRSTVEL